MLKPHENDNHVRGYCKPNSSVDRRGISWDVQTKKKQFQTCWLPPNSAFSNSKSPEPSETGEFISGLKSPIAFQFHWVAFTYFTGDSHVFHRVGSQHRSPREIWARLRSPFHGITNRSQACQKPSLLLLENRMILDLALELGVGSYPNPASPRLVWWMQRSHQLLGSNR